MYTVTQSDWEDFIGQNPSCHLLQTSQWGEFKAQFGWQPVRIIAGHSGAQILFRRLPLGYSIAYIPKGPVGEITPTLLTEIEEICVDQKAIIIYVEPDAWEEDFDASQLIEGGFRESRISIQPRRTIVIELDGDEEIWLERMKQKTRYNIRLAKKKNVEVNSSKDVDTFIRLMKITGTRNMFSVHNEAYYRTAYDIFSSSGNCELLIAYYQQKPLAALMVFYQGVRAWYFYGASSNLERNRMANYLLQFEAMRWAKMKGCKLYDLWGIPDYDEEQLEAQFTSRNDGLWSVYRFKRGFGGLIKRSAGVYEKVIHPIPYTIYAAMLRLRKWDAA